MIAQRVLGPLYLAVALLGCDPEEERNPACDAICDSLVTECAIDAFPNHGSCVQGCGYNASIGADVVRQLACVQAAACDTFDIVECEHQFGVPE